MNNYDFHENFLQMIRGSNTGITQGITFRFIGFLVALMFNTSAWSHSGHDHGDDDEKPTAAAEVSAPRLAVETSLFQLVGEAHGEVLTFYLDTFETNTPVAGAIINVTAGIDDQVAEERSNGTYQISGDWVATSGQHDLIISITAGEDADLMLAELTVPESTAVLGKTVSTWWENYLPESLNTYVTPALTSAASFISSVNTGYLFAAIFAVGMVLGLFIRNTVFPVASIVLALALITAPEQTLAHSGHDHGDNKEVAVSTGNRPQRLADGSVFLPKPTQRLLQIRSTIATLSNVPLSVRLLGKTLSDPAYTGVVQAVRDGLIDFPSKKLPTIGETVKAGDVVAMLTPVLTPETQVSMTEQLGVLAQQIAVAKQRLNRLQSVSQISVSGQGTDLNLSAVSKGSLEELELQVATLSSRRSALNEISFASLELVASRSGTISNVSVTAGQVVSAGDTLIEIIDPNRVWVEAVAYPEQNTDFVTKARAVLPKNASLPLSFVSRSLSLTAQTQTLYFKLEEHEAVPTGTPVTVILESDIQENKLLLPRSSVVRGSSGLMIVWIQESPEIFRPQIVKAQSLDGIQMKINAGLNEGERVVIEGASFLSQVR